MAEHKPNQIYRQFTGILGLNPTVAYDSSPRQQMISSHLSQTLVISDSTERRIQTGMEREIGKYTFSIKMPVDAEIIKIIERYNKTMDFNSINHNPQTIVIYEDVNTKVVGMIELLDYCSYHQHFGFKYKKTNAYSNLRKGAAIPAGTILQDSPSITTNGGYKYGRECNVAFMTHPAVAEDAILVSDELLDKFKIRTYETRIIEFGSDYYPLNIYGDINNFKAFPDIGEFIRTDGLLMALRKHDDILGPVDQGIRDLMEVDHMFDKTTYANGGGGKVIDIRVHHDNQNYNPPTPMGMELQAQKYDDARRVFYSEIIHEYNRLKRERGDNLRVTPQLHRLVVEALAVIGEPDQRIIKMSGKNPIDDWRLEFVIEYEIQPNIGFKMTDVHAAKGVICKIIPKEHMPVDMDGNRADIVMDPNATVSRMNPGRLYEQYINGAARDLVKRLNKKVNKDMINSLDNETIENIFNEIVSFYHVVSDRMYKWFTNNFNFEQKKDHIKYVLNNGIYLYMPPENERELMDVVRELETSGKFPQTYGPVTYVGNSGRTVTTKKPVRIASTYIILLEKTGDDWTSVSSGILQCFGILATVPRSMRYNKPYRTQAIRAIGESEGRIYASYAGPQVTADIFDRNNSVISHESVVDSILKADKPTNIDCAVKRDIIPFGNSRPIQIVKHLGQCAGWRFVYKKSPI